MTMRSLAAALALAVAVTPAAAGERAARTRNDQPAQARLVQKTYAVADIIVPLLNSEDLAPMLLEKVSPTAPARKKAAPADSPEKTIEGRLIELILKTVAPHTWSIVGGPGTIDYYPLGMSLVVTQTADVQERVAELLESLRRQLETEVVVEVRFLHVPESFWERVGLDFDSPAKDQGKGGRVSLDEQRVFQILETVQGKGDRVSLDERQVFQILEAVQGDRRSSVLQSPKLTVFNGQSAVIECTEQQTFVTDLNVSRKKDDVRVTPETTVVTTGQRLQVQPAVSNDRASVSLKLSVEQAELDPAAVPLVPVTVPLSHSATDQDQPNTSTQYVQRPHVRRESLKTTLKLKDGQSALLYGWSKPIETRTEYGPPVLSRVPYVNRLFKNVGYGREEGRVLILVTSRLIVNEAEEVSAATPAPADESTESNQR